MLPKGITHLVSYHSSCKYKYFYLALLSLSVCLISPIPIQRSNFHSIEATPGNQPLVWAKIRVELLNCGRRSRNGPGQGPQGQGAIPSYGKMPRSGNDLHSHYKWTVEAITTKLYFSTLEIYIYPQQVLFQSGKFYLCVRLFRRFLQEQKEKMYLEFHSYLQYIFLYSACLETKYGTYSLSIQLRLYS